MRTRLPLVIAGVLPILSPDVAVAQTALAIEDIRLLARPYYFESPPWSVKPPAEAVELTAAWSAMDYEDSVVVEVEVRLPAAELERALLVTHVQVAVARAVGERPEDPESMLDWDRMYRNEVWLPAFESFAVPVAEGKQVSAGRYVVTLGHFLIEPVRDELYRHDRRLTVTHLRVTAALIANRADDYSAEHFVERTIIIGLN